MPAREPAGARGRLPGRGPERRREGARWTPARRALAWHASAGGGAGDVGMASASSASSHPRHQFPDETNWNDSTSTRHRFSDPGEDMRTSNGLVPREGTTPNT